MNEKQLCHELMVADSEDRVVSVLQDCGYWDNPRVWRYLGDNENNYGSIGNQQSRPVAALIEKLVNGVDARLMNASLARGIDPESPEAPANMREAVAIFFDGWQRVNNQSVPPEAGLIRRWPRDQLRAEADLLTLTATGYGPKSGSGRPCITIADAGEGQTPDRFPDTFLSLQRSNKLRVPFVQGKFNMGATGVLQFCSPTHRLQLIISRRNPALLSSPQPRDRNWGFTIVRREPAPPGTRSSVFTYLAPWKVEAGRDGHVLSFTSDDWPIFPVVDSDGRDAYRRTHEYGSLVKLYEYDLEGYRSNIVRSGGNLLQRIDFGMPELALPTRFYECRPHFRGHLGSFSTNVLGIVSRLDRDHRNRLEKGTPVRHIMQIKNKEIRLSAYVLKGNAKEYRSGSDAIAFTINGQTHATKDLRFFRRSTVGLSQLAESLVLIVDCTKIDGQLREDLFMNSRDRLREVPLASQIEKGITDFLSKDRTLKEIRNRRRREEITKKLQDARPLADALSDLVKQTPSLSRILDGGHTIPTPFPDPKPDPPPFQGKRYPTYFRFWNRDEGHILERDARLEAVVRIRMETDAENEHFHRDTDRGVYEVEMAGSNSNWMALPNLSLNGPVSGSANLSLELPDGLSAGDTANVRIRITDPSRIDEFRLSARLRIVDAAKPTPFPPKSRLALPTIIPVEKDDWSKHEFDELSAVKVVGQGHDSKGHEQFDYYVNVDNKYLLLAQKCSKREPETLRAQFIYSLVLFSMALLIKERSKFARQDGLVDVDPESTIKEITRKLAPFVLPTLEALGSISE